MVNGSVPELVPALVSALVPGPEVLPVAELPERPAESWLSRFGSAHAVTASNERMASDVFVMRKPKSSGD